MTRSSIRRASLVGATLMIGLWLGGCDTDADQRSDSTGGGTVDSASNDSGQPDSGAAESRDLDTMEDAEGPDSTDMVLDSGTPPGPAMQTLEIETGRRTGMLDRPWGGIMDSAGDTVCWSDIALNGTIVASLRYSNGENAGDRVDISFGGTVVGSLPIGMCALGGAWAGSCGDTTAEIDVSGTEELCLTGVGSGWIAALDVLTLSAPTECAATCHGAECGDDGCGGSCGACLSGTACDNGRCAPQPTCSDGVANQGELGVDCGGPCAACSSAACSATNSAYVPAQYECIWSDEFGGNVGAGQAKAALDSGAWTFQNLDVNGEAQNYTNRECADPAHAGNWNYCVEDGALTLRARAESIDCSDGPDSDNQPDNPDCAQDWGQSRRSAAYTSGRIISKHKVAHRYGYIEYRARLPHYNRTPQSGMWPAIWLLGNNISEGPPPGSTAWPWCGEIDMMEWQSPHNHMGWNAIWIGAEQNLDACSDFPKGGSAVCGPCTGGSCRGVEQNGDRWRWNGWSNFPHTTFHTYGFLWTQDVMEVFIDGDKVSTLRLGPDETEFQQAMFLIVNLAIGGSLGGPVQITDWSTATLEVDYIRWYQRD
ncbi:MAG: beta-glucanase (GH16 family) [Myxococcota bacterium]|jgi:beta-glucanase (GH16 family)